MDEEKVEWLGKARVMRLTCAQTCKISINILDQKKKSRLECITCLLSYRNRHESQASVEAKIHQQTSQIGTGTDILGVKVRMESHNKGSFWTTLEKEACDNNDHCGGKGYPRNVRAT